MSGNASLPPWMSVFHDSLETHLKTYESPQLEILPHPTPDRGTCGSHETHKTHINHFCLFLCCAKEISRFCMQTLREVMAAEVEQQQQLQLQRELQQPQLQQPKLQQRQPYSQEQEEDLEVPGAAGSRKVKDENDVKVGGCRLIRNKPSGINCNKDINDLDQSSVNSTKPMEIPHLTLDDNHHHLSFDSLSLVVRLSRLSLLVQPEDYRSWNVLKDASMKPPFELKFAYFVLTKHPRSAETFCHLRYLSRRICIESRDTFEAKTSLCGRGFKRCEEAASRYHGNYHAWDHRRFLAALLVQDLGHVNIHDDDDANNEIPVSSQCQNDEEISSIIQKELDDVKTWQSTRVSDACPFKYRLFLVETRTKAKLTGVKFDFVSELSDLNRLMRIYSGHESLWNHRRDFMQLARKEVVIGSKPNQTGSTETGSGSFETGGTGSVDFDFLRREDATFLAGVEASTKNDWEMTLFDRYQSQMARMEGDE